MLEFSSYFHHPNINGVFVLPAFPDPVFDPDCVHFTEECGPR
jgi:hypothetical protein